MTRAPARLCRGVVAHRRYRPKRHSLSYRVFSLLVDLDDLDRLASEYRWLGVNRPAPVSLWEADHGAGEPRGLKRHIQNLLDRTGTGPRQARITMLTFPRVVGYVFNPLTVYFCRDHDDRLETLVYEVNNTFGERHFYVIALDDPEARIHFQSLPKAFHVSPFNRVEGDYAFRTVLGADHLTIGVSLKVDGEPLLNAFHSARSEPLTDRALLSAVAAMPLMTLKVIAGIHFEALRLWLKGLRLNRRPRHAVSVTHLERTTGHR